ncbi:SH3 domain-containing protein [Weeksellaceae bacterium TAE3-ERU29]|nr:SH3 domain-containing protein [Weeksellaceae bacterium TAE3-ERU29]
MNKLLIILSLVTTFVFAQENKYHELNADFTNGETYYLFGDDVKLRAEPNTDSEVLDLLKIGTPIKIISKTNHTLNYNGLESPFYKVKYQDKMGYILGGLISLEKRGYYKSEYLFAYKKTGEYDYSLIIRYLNAEPGFKEIITNLETPTFSIDIFDNKGVQGIENILYINYLSEACGVDGGGIYFFQVKNDLKKVFEVAQISDAGIFWLGETLTFPTDENGMENKIIYSIEQGFSTDESSYNTEAVTITKELEWKNGKFTPDNVQKSARKRIDEFFKES